MTQCAAAPHGLLSIFKSSDFRKKLSAFEKKHGNVLACTTHAAEE
jgi:hypothetical protein